MVDTFGSFSLNILIYLYLKLTLFELRDKSGLQRLFLQHCFFFHFDTKLELKVFSLFILTYLYKIIISTKALSKGPVFCNLGVPIREDFYNFRAILEPCLGQSLGKNCPPTCAHPPTKCM